MWRLDVSAEAEVEIFEAALRYEREKSGLGLRFEADLARVLLGWGTTHSSIHRSKPKRGEPY